MFKITLDQVYRPFFMFFRTRRMKSFKEIFRVTKTTKILDVGGTYFVWTLVPDLPIPIIVNVLILEMTTNRQLGSLQMEEGYHLQIVLST